MCYETVVVTLISTSAHVLHSGALSRVFYTLSQDSGQWVSFCPHDELHRGTFCGPSLAVEQAQALTLDLVLMKLINAVIDEGGWSLFVQDCHLELDLQI